MFAIKIKGAGYIFPKKFPFVIGKNGDIPANVPFSIRFEVEKGKVMVSSDGIFKINNSTSSLSILKPGDLINFCGIELRIERKFLAHLKNFSFPLLSGLLLAVILSGFLKGEVLNGRKRIENPKSDCFTTAKEIEYRARSDLKLIPSALEFIERCISFLDEKETSKRDELIKYIGALKSVQDEEFRRLKFEAEMAIRNGDISSAIKSLQEIKEIINNPSDERWRYASYRMRELLK